MPDHKTVRLRYAPMKNDKRTISVTLNHTNEVDDLARVAFEAFWEDCDTLDTWDNQRDGFKDQWRRVVRRVLEAKAKGRESAE